MHGWQTTFLGMHELPGDMSGFAMKAFFTFDGAERKTINARRGDAHKLSMALRIGFLRMSGRLLCALRLVPVPRPPAAAPQRGTWYCHPRCGFATHSVWP